MHDNQYGQIINLWKTLRGEPDAKEEIARRTQIGINRVKAVIGQYESQGVKDLVTYRINMKAKVSKI